MTTNKRERDFLIKLFSASQFETKVLWKKSTCFSSVIMCVGRNDSDRYIYRNITNKYGVTIGRELIGSIPGTQIVSPTEILIDRLEDIRELIHTRQSSNFRGWRRLEIWPTDEFLKIVKDFDSQIGALTESANPTDALILDQLLKGLLSEFRT